MDGKVYGYARVSTKNQNEDRQVIALEAYGIDRKYILVEKQSGKDFDRPAYRRLLKKLKTGDTLVITSLDRLGRDYTEVQEQWRVINKERGVSIVVLDMPLLNTKETSELITQLISDLVLGIFSFVAQTERENIRARQREGIEAARARGVRFGRPRLSVPDDFEDMAKRWRSGEFTAWEAARMLGFSRSTFFRRVNEVEARSAEQENASVGVSASEDDSVSSVSDESVSSARQEPEELPQVSQADCVEENIHEGMSAAASDPAPETDVAENLTTKEDSGHHEESHDTAAFNEQSVEIPVIAVPIPSRSAGASFVKPSQEEAHHTPCGNSLANIPRCAVRSSSQDTT